MISATRNVLPPFYYLDNYHYLLDFVEKKSSHLLSLEETAFIHDFRKLSKQAQALYVRMFNRSGLYFNVEKFRYREIKNLKRSLMELTGTGFAAVLTIEDLMIPEKIFKVFTRDEICKIYQECKNKKLKSSIRREHLINEISLLPIDIICKAINDSFNIIKQLRSGEAEMIKFLFFGSVDIDMTEFVIRDIGHAKFENYDEQKLSSFFSCRKEADDKWNISQAYKYYKENRDAMSPENLYHWFKSQNINNISEVAHPLYYKLVNKLAYDLERNSFVHEALELYGCTTQYPARERRIRLLSKLKKCNEAAELCQEVLENSVDPREKIFASDYLNKNETSYRQTTHKLKLAEVVEIPATFEGRVEEGVMQFYMKQGYNSFFSENYLWRSVFGLTFWKVIYDTDCGTIHNPLQRAPSDFYTSGFFQKRDWAIKKVCKLINTKRELRRLIKNTWKEKYGKVNPLFGWDEVQLKMINKLISKIRPQQLNDVLLEMCTNLKSNSSGFPDLFVFNKNEYFFAEIKSPNDHLSEQQLHWMNFFEEKKINVKLIKVNWK